MERIQVEHIPPYISYRTFSNFMAELKARGLPSRIDRSVMAHKSGTIQSQLLLALRYLHLVKGAGQPTEKLQKLLESRGSQRKTILKQVVENSYRKMFEEDFGLATATSDQMEEIFQKTGASGETVRRCVAFFLAVARDGGISVSSYIKPHRRRKGTSRKREPSHRPPALAEQSLEPVGVKRVQLRSGGSLSFRLQANVFDLDRVDREFIFDLIDRLKDYQEKIDLSGG